MPSSSRFLEHYADTGITKWGASGTLEELYSYANVYAFGAYLARNYGGAALIKAMAENNRVNEASISAALSSAANPSSATVRDFGQALSKYGEALVYNDTTGDRGSFKKTVTKTITGNLGNYTYEFTGFDIMVGNRSGSFPYNGPYILTGSKVNKGPLIFSLGYQFEMYPHSIIVQSRMEWLNVSAPLTVTVEEYPGVEIHLLTRRNP
jgi:hypothetical protein